MTTARGIVTKALQKVGAIVKNETPSADEANDGLDALNALLSSWSNESMLVYKRTWENFPLVAGDVDYTIGVGQNFNTVRPTYIVEAHVRQDVTDYPLAIISDEIYNGSISDKSSQGIPKFLNYDNGYSTGTIRLYPVPDTSYTLYILTEKPLTSFALDDEVTLPPGWERALIYNLAVELFPEYGQQVDQAVYEIAKDSKRSIQSAVLKTRSMDVQPAAIGNRNNIYTGGYR